jgi:predicted hydrocarbon binding protein
VHGVIFTSLRDYASSVHGADAAKQLFEGEPIFLLSEAYPDERFERLLERAMRLTGMGSEELIYDFGVFTAQITFTRLYPAFFAIAGSPREFLLSVEERIHELVRATIPHASPPQLHVAPHGEEGVAIEYTSPRRLCVLLRGLTEGTARHYGQTATIEETTCMLHGDPACRFEVQLSAESQSA